jgi:hypothetical protein
MIESVGFEFRRFGEARSMQEIMATLIPKIADAYLARTPEEVAEGRPAGPSVPESIPED